MGGGGAAGARRAGERNVLGGPLELCGVAPLTGFFRDGYCCTGPQDAGRHVVCASVTEEFLEYTKARGNDLSSPAPAYGFPGLRPGDRWCLCASRWSEALRAGKAPKVRPGPPPPPWAPCARPPRPAPRLSPSPAPLRPGQPRLTRAGGRAWAGAPRGVPREDAGNRVAAGPPGPRRRPGGRRRPVSQRRTPRTGGGRGGGGGAHRAGPTGERGPRKLE